MNIQKNKLKNELNSSSLKVWLRIMRHMKIKQMILVALIVLFLSALVIPLLLFYSHPPETNESNDSESEDEPEIQSDKDLDRSSSGLSIVRQTLLDSISGSPLLGKYFVSSSDFLIDGVSLQNTPQIENQSTSELPSDFTRIQALLPSDSGSTGPSHDSEISYEKV